MEKCFLPYFCSERRSDIIRVVGYPLCYICAGGSCGPAAPDAVVCHANLSLKIENNGMHSIGARASRPTPRLRQAVL